MKIRNGDTILYCSFHHKGFSEVEGYKYFKVIVLNEEEFYWSRDVNRDNFMRTRALLTEKEYYNRNGGNSVSFRTRFRKIL